MIPSKLDDLLTEARAEKSDALPTGFAAGVVSAARQVHESARANWRILFLFSVATLLFSGFLGFYLARESSEATPPPLSLFHERSDGMNAMP